MLTKIEHGGTDYFTTWTLSVGSTRTQSLKSEWLGTDGHAGSRIGVIQYKVRMVARGL